MLAINNERYIERAEIIREKGTNRSAFFRGEADKYGWVDIGSSFLPSDLIAAFLFAQLESLVSIQKQRIRLWNLYRELLEPLQADGLICLPIIPPGATNNAHMFYVVCQSLEDRTRLIKTLEKRSILAAFHYQALHRSRYYMDKHDGRALPNADRYTDCLVRLPLYCGLSDEDIQRITRAVYESFGQ